MSEQTSKRAKLFLILFLVVAGTTALYLVYDYFIGSRRVTTDNAYVGAEIAQVTSAVGGIVQSINHIDTDTVKKGDVLVVIDPTDANLALSRANANLAMANADLARTKIDYERRQKLAHSGSVSAEEVSNTDNAYKMAQASADAAQVAVDQAEVDLSRTTLVSPADGVVVKRMVQLGQRVQAGSPLMSVVPVQALHVDANLKESQVRHVRIGQPVKMQADLYGSSVTFKGKVVGIAGGTGATMAVIPAQNATGNWIKVVQRLPVSISLDPAQLEEHPLQAGLSMNVTIDISEPKK